MEEGCVYRRGRKVLCSAPGSALKRVKKSGFAATRAGEVRAALRASALPRPELFRDSPSTSGPSLGHPFKLSSCEMKEEPKLRVWPPHNSRVRPRSHAEGEERFGALRSSGLTCPSSDPAGIWGLEWGSSGSLSQQIPIFLGNAAGSRQNIWGKEGKIEVKSQDKGIKISQNRRGFGVGRDLSTALLPGDTGGLGMAPASPILGELHPIKQHPLLHQGPDFIMGPQNLLLKPPRG